MNKYDMNFNNYGMNTNLKNEENYSNTGINIYRNILTDIAIIAL